jgi:hypothetical protein
MAMVNLIGEHTVLVKSAEGASSDTLPQVAGRGLFREVMPEIAGMRKPPENKG